MPALRTRDTQARSLEVITDAPQQLPVLNIVSPTPRAFTFPTTHNLSDSPYSSPSTSPFEPDLMYPLSLQCSTPSPTSSLDPDSPIRSSSPFTPEHKRRKSSCSSTDLVDRRPKKGDEDYIKRPENAFILFRRKCCEDRQRAEDVAAADNPTKKQRQADLSKTISQQWKSLSAEERQYWEQMAKDKKKEHEQLYPSYVYRPQRAKDKDGKTKNKKTKKSDLEDTGSVSFVVPVHRHHHGRSASAPTPPPYQSIQIPNVYQMTLSCPTSPSSFDYLPSNSFVPSSFPLLSGQFEASVQSSDFLRNVFNTLSPSSSTASTSTGPSTPASALLPENYAPSDPFGVDTQAQAEIDLQMEMQMQQEFASYSWGNNGSLWGSDSVLLRDDFDLNAIPPIELGLPKYTENLTLAAPNVSGLEFGQEFSDALEGPQYLDNSQNLGSILGFEELMAGHGF